MNDFLNYEILGLITVQTYLIIAFADIVLSCAFNKKNKPFSKLSTQALIWPLKLTLMASMFVFLAVIGLVALIAKVFS